MGRLIHEWHLPHIAWVVFWLWGEQEMDVLTSSCINQCQHYNNTLEDQLSSRSIEVECFQPSLEVSGELSISSFSNNFPGSVQVSDWTCHRSMQTSHCCCALLDGVSLTSYYSQQFGSCSHWCPIMKYLIKDVLVGWVLKGLSWLQLTALAGHRHMLCRCGFSS